MYTTWSTNYKEMESYSKGTDSPKVSPPKQ
jgi:hypothetical protein